MATEKIYNSKNIENDIYEFWLKNQLFEPIKQNKKLKNFSIILPPPNVTGNLHIGHAWDTTIQDTIIRYKKLRGYRTIFIPGTDHAGISAQTKFEKVLAANGVDRSKLSDVTFLKQLRAWVETQKNTIHRQWAKIGLALAYNYEVFTLDPCANKLVNDAFIKLYRDGLIYRANRLTNWDVKLKTAISDIEVITKPTPQKLYYFRYQIKDNDDYLVIATTRPETMFVDTTVFVHPNDQRYKKYIGKYAINPINNQPLPIMADAYIDQKFGTGVMKCTPAHDFNDYALAKKYQITNFASVIDEDGKLNQLAKTPDGNFTGIDRLKARNKIVEYLTKIGKVEKIEDYTSNVGYSERSNEVIEPLLSKQWFIKMKPVVKKMKAIEKSAKVFTNFLPPRFQKTMNQWLNNIDDWCISRQLLWGHQIPVWYKKNSTEIYVGDKPPRDPSKYVKDRDVLDTWFSSGLWPLTLTKFADHKKILKDFYPISILVTGYDILFFWVARMLFQCSYLDDSISLQNVLLHGLIRDEQNRKMSKSLGNGIDPMDVIAQYGADAMRCFFMSSTTSGEDLRFSKQKIEYMWAFINKLWNCANLISPKPLGNSSKNFHHLHRWILQALNQTIVNFTKQMDQYNFVVAFKYLIDFAWETFCNKFVELKNILPPAQTASVLRLVYRQILIMLHPFAPFVTEQIYQRLYREQKSIMLEKIVVPKSNKYVMPIETKLLLTIYSVIKDWRIKHGIKKDVKINIYIKTKARYNQKQINADLTQLNVVLVNDLKNAKTTNHVFDQFAICIINQAVDHTQEIARLNKLIATLTDELKRSNGILSNQAFLKNASAEKVQTEKAKRQKYQAQYDEAVTMLKKIKA